MVRAEIGSHVFTVEFHVYLYHLLDSLPDYDLPKLEGSSNGAESLETEHVDVSLVKQDGRVNRYEKIIFPKRFNDVLDFYLFDLEPIFFPSYEYHTVSPNGVTLKHAVVQSHYQNNLVMFVVPELMLNVELKDIKMIEWRTSRGMEYSLELVDVISRVCNARMLKEPRQIPFENRKAIITNTSVDLRPKCPIIQNQGDLGTCGVTALTSFLEFITGKRLSVLFIYYVTRVLTEGHLPHDDSGVELADCLKALSKYGICREETWPYDLIKFPDPPSPQAFEEAAIFKPVDFQRLTSIEELKDTLSKELPIVLDVNFAPLTYGRECAETGKVPKPKSLTELDPDSCEHTVLIVGFNDETQEFLFQNSWGTTWGKSGYGFLPYDYIKQGMFRNAYTWKDPFALPVKSFDM